MMDTVELLKNHWGYSNFLPKQEKIINAVLAGKDCIALLPTGGGKSICYQIPGLALEGVCIVVSPLIALIQDQVANLKKKNIKAIALTSKLSLEETINAFDNLQFGNFKFLYLSPEKLQSPLIKDKIKQLNVSIIAIDEAHCISEWGHDFRPSYLLLHELRTIKPEAITIALTATATSKVLKDIQLNLDLKDLEVFKQSFQRNNLNYRVIKTEDIYGRLLHELRKINDSIIIYVSTRKQTKEISSFLRKNSFNSSYYHGGQSLTEKNKAYELWMQNKTPIMVATNAFGMGIDKPDVRAVVHIGMPNSLENYIQEAGRAGRNGSESYSLVLTNESLIFESESKFKTTVATVKFVRQVYQFLNQYYAISIGEIPQKPFEFSMAAFCDDYKLPIVKVYNAITILERQNIIQLEENYKNNSQLKFTISNQGIFDFIETHPQNKELIQLILRSYGGVVAHYSVINEYILAKKLKKTEVEIKNQLQELNRLGILSYQYTNTNSKLTFLVCREDPFVINNIAKSIEQQRNLKFEKLKACISYAQNNTICRNKQLLAYFDEFITTSCGKCDVCLSKKPSKASIGDISNHILGQLKGQNLSSQELIDRSNYSSEDVLFSLKILLDENKITLTSQNKIKLGS
jgi:ATP-dependent DNA helicase RecQ